MIPPEVLTVGVSTRRQRSKNSTGLSFGYYYRRLSQVNRVENDRVAFGRIHG
jgi:hypothetical protein